ncbi:hypothetical protein [Neotabrizicola sp. VNH66]|uniref:hypothetical protein n=1 Tax=Neotabrizicola sp. VNH66 TaxID=3400918 RepID=UPI003C1258A4
MALSQAEMQRQYRKRLKEKAKLANLAAADETFRLPFCEFFNESGSSVAETLAIGGMYAPVFDDDRGPRPHGVNGVFDHNHDDDPALDDSVRSLGRAELVIETLIDAAAEFAAKVNEYKRQEIKARLAEIEASDLSEPEAKKAALKDAARLNKMLDQLDKQVRWTFPQWKVTG